MIGNAPRALLKAPVPLLAEERTQMSFGERAALEGLLSQLRPKLAVEVGSAQGGSLTYLSRHAHRVHAFDLQPPGPVRANVTVHVGDSHETVPPVLKQLAKERRRVDFALVDGDHTAEGVRADLLALLDSSACGRTVILVHDTHNPTVREGVASAALDDHPRIVYHELDWVRGYTFAHGPFTGQQWGGLGLDHHRQPRHRRLRRHPAPNPLPDHHGPAGRRRTMIEHVIRTEPFVIRRAEGGRHLVIPHSETDVYRMPLEAETHARVAKELAMSDEELAGEEARREGAAKIALPDGINGSSLN